MAQDEPRFQWMIDEYNAMFDKYSPVAQLSKRPEETPPMTTDKQRITIYLADRRPLDDLTEQLRVLAPLEQRGAISRSTTIEAAIDICLADVLLNGQTAAIYQLVTSP